MRNATGGTLRPRALVSAAGAGSLWDLRCLVREHLVAWIRDQRPTAMPRMRAELGDAAGNLAWQRAQPLRPEQPPAGPERRVDARVFGGGEDGEACGTFAAPEEPVDAGR